MRTSVALHGVRPEPLASYLKGLALLRIVAEQCDHQATGHWLNDHFVLTSHLTLEALQQFLLHDWCPTPLVAPWNGGSGFYDNDNRDGIQAIQDSTQQRFSHYRVAIAESRNVLSALGMSAKPDGPEAKSSLVYHLRGALPDEAIRWLDAAVVLGGDDPRYPPLVGTGGNDGRLEFSNNQMKRLAELLLSPGPPPGPHQLAVEQLQGALSDAPTRRERASIGQFAPNQAGGANMGFGFDGHSLVNPWDYVLALEGAICFAAAVSRSHAGGIDAAFPFFVESTSAGYASAVENEENRGEVWLPLWGRPATWPELASLIGEGRSWVSLRPATNGADFGRAVRHLGVARGIDAFQRFAFAQRNGLAFFATSAGRHLVDQSPTPDPLVRLDGWLRRLRDLAKPGSTCPASIRRALRRVDEALLQGLAPADREPQLLVALGRLSEWVTSSRHSSAVEGVRPMPVTDDGSWPHLAETLDPAWRIAFALADGGLRSELQPVTEGPRPDWTDLSRENELGSTVQVYTRLLRVAGRRLHHDANQYVRKLRATSDVADLLALVNGLVDQMALRDALAGALVAAEIPGVREGTLPGGSPVPLSLALCGVALHGPPNHADPWPLPRAMLHALVRGDGETAARTAIQHLRANRIALDVAPPGMSSDLAQRIAVALMLPISSATHFTLWHVVAPTTATS